MNTDTTDSSQDDAPGDFADLADLEREAGAIEGVAAERAAPPPIPDTTAAELLGALEMARLMISPGMAWWPAYGEVWNDRTLRGIADSGADVMQRHGWSMGDLLSQWGPYIGLIGATLPPSLVTWQAVKDRREQAEREAKSPATARPANDGWHGPRGANGEPVAGAQA